jgi:hypothetical protein
MTAHPSHPPGEAERRAVEAYGAAQLSDAGGYSSATHSYMREDVILHMYEILMLLRQAFLAVRWRPEELREKELLEVGCSWGFRLNQLLGFDFVPERLHGIDLIPEFIEAARRLHPSMNFEVMSARRMTYPDRRFDGTVAIMALSAMLQAEVVNEALAEMCRVSRDFILVIDNFRRNYEDARHGTVFLRGVDRGQIAALAHRPDVAEIRELGSFWSTSRFAWKAYAALRRIAPSIAYAAAIRMPGPHSHRAYLVRLRPPQTR